MGSWSDSEFGWDGTRGVPFLGEYYWLDSPKFSWLDAQTLTCLAVSDRLKAGQQDGTEPGCSQLLP